MSFTDLHMDRWVRKWTVTASADNATATASKGATADRNHVITCILASFGTTPATNKLLQIKYGTTVVGEFFVGAPVVIPVEEGLYNPTTNQAVSAELAASGTGGVLGNITLIGFTTGPLL